jgi:hypothetical protein
MGKVTQRYELRHPRRRGEGLSTWRQREKVAPVLKLRDTKRRLTARGGAR